jgi:PKD repeat protein
MRTPLTAAPRRLAVGLVALAVGAAVLAVPGTALADTAPTDPTNPATPPTVTADPLPTVQIDGVAWSQAVVGNTVYVAGKFGFARPAGAAAGTQQTVRNNLLAYDIRTGKLITSFAPDLNGQAMVVTASPDGSRIYVGGDFTVANGQTRHKVAAYSTATGQLDPAFKPAVYGQVRAIAATGSTVYLGGSITQVGSTGRTRLAAVTAATGALLPWAPVPAASSGGSDQVTSMVVTGGGSQVVVGGHFATISGKAAPGVGAVDATTGAVKPFAVNTLEDDQGQGSAILSLTLSADGRTVYGTGYNYAASGGTGNLEGLFSADAVTGKPNWFADCQGDTYGSFPVNGLVYVSSHEHDCKNIGYFPQGVPEPAKPTVWKYATAFTQAAEGKVGNFVYVNGKLIGQPAPAQVAWYPTLSQGTYTKQYQAGWTVSGNSQYVVYGGEFPKVNGVAQQGLVRFGVRSLAPGKVAPSGTSLSLTSLSPGTARVSWVQSSDMDNENLTYRVYRDNGTSPVYSVTAPSRWFNVRPMAFNDSGLAAGTHTYRLVVTDPDRNSAATSWTSVTVQSGTPAAARHYADLVRADGAVDYWPLDEPTRDTAHDRAGGQDMTVHTGVATGQAGALSGDRDTAYSFDGSTSGFTATKSAYLAPQTFSVEAWFSTTSTAGGKIVGFGDNNAHNSMGYDRHVYMDGSGKVWFGVWPNMVETVNSPGSYNDGKWHHVVATLGSGGMALYLDGKLTASRTSVTSGNANYGYWRIGGDQSWAGANFFTGRIDEVAVYPTALTPAQVGNHYTAAKGGNAAPVASFTATTNGLGVGVDGSASSDSDGRVASWAWTFGDGGTATGTTAQHTYAAAGTYPVTLTVTDDRGATATRTTSVTVTPPPPNQPPTASFTAAVSGRTGSFDGSASKDPDGSIAAWSWDFGDGATGAGATASHTYAADGSYPVVLTVTDNAGATGTARSTVTVAGATLAADSFGRTVTGGLGTADTGGAWTSSAGPTRQSVTPGAAQLRIDAANQNTGAYLGDVSSATTDVLTTVSLSSAPTGGGTYVYVTGRRVAGQGEYRVRVRFLADGTVALALSRLTGTTESFPGGETTVPGLTVAPGTPVDVRVRVSGTGTTTVGASVWTASGTEPATPQRTWTDTTAALQAPGAVGITAHTPSDSTAATVVRVTAFRATAD